MSLRYFAFDILRSIFCIRYFVRRYFAHSIFCHSIFCDTIFCDFDILRIRYFAIRYFATSIFCGFDILRFRYFAFDILRSIFCDSIFCFSIFCPEPVWTPPPPPAVFRGQQENSGAQRRRVFTYLIPCFWQLLWKFRSWVMQGQVTRSGQVTIPYKSSTIAPQLQCFEGKLWNFRNMIRSSVPTKCISRIFYIGDLRSGNFRDLPIIGESMSKNLTPCFMLHLEFIWMESHQVMYLFILQVNFLVGDCS